MCRHGSSREGLLLGIEVGLELCRRHAGFLWSPEERPLRTHRAAHSGDLVIRGEHAIEDLPDLVIKIAWGKRAVDLSQPELEPLEGACERSRRSLALAKVGLERAGPLLVLLDRDLGTVLDAEPFEGFRPVAPESLGRIWTGRKVSHHIKEDVSRLVQERREVGLVGEYDLEDLLHPLPHAIDVAALTLRQGRTR